MKNVESGQHVDAPVNVAVFAAVMVDGGRR